MARRMAGLRIGGFWQKAGGWLMPLGEGGEGYGALLRTRGREIGYCALLVFASGIGQTFLLSLFQAQWRQTLGLTEAQMGALYGGATLASGLLLPWAGRWFDVVAVRTATIVVLGGLSLAAVAAGSVVSIWMLAVALFLLRFFGQGLASMLGITCAARWFNRNRAKAVSLTGLGFPLGEALLPALLVLSIAGLGWRATFWILAVVAVGGFLPLALRLLRGGHGPYTEATEAAGAAHSDGRRSKLLQDWRFYAMLAISVPVPFMGTGIIFFQASIAEARGWNAAIFPTGFIVFAVVRAGFSLVAGSWADRLGSLRLLPLPTSLFALGLLCLLPSPVAFAYVFFAILGVGFGASSGILTAAWTEIFGAERIGLVKGLSGSVGVFSTALAPVAFGMAFAAGISLNLLLTSCAVAILAVAWPLSVVLSRVQRAAG